MFTFFCSTGYYFPQNLSDSLLHHTADTNIAFLYDVLIYYVLGDKKKLINKEGME